MMYTILKIVLKIVGGLLLLLVCICAIDWKCGPQNVYLFDPVDSTKCITLVTPVIPVSLKQFVVFYKCEGRLLPPKDDFIAMIPTNDPGLYIDWRQSGKYLFKVGIPKSKVNRDFHLDTTRYGIIPDCNDWHKVIGINEEPIEPYQTYYSFEMEMFN